MRLTLCIPVMNQFNDSKPALTLFRQHTTDEVEWMVIDNGSTEPYEDFITHYLKPERLQFVKNKSNIGLIKTYQQAYESCETDILVMTHNDVFIYEKEWDLRLKKIFEENHKIGAVGLFGAQGCGPIGERIQDVPAVNIAAGFSNMVEAELHGFRMQQEVRPAAIFDGFFMAFRMEALKKSNGFDQRYIYHHIYDRDCSLEVLRHGYYNVVLNLYAHHTSGMTANRPEYQTWIDEKTQHSNYTGDKFTHDKNTEIFKEKWKDVLPIYVEDDFSFRTGSRDFWEFKGDAITKLV